MSKEKFTKPSNSGMQDSDKPRFDSVQDVLKNANRQQRRAYERKTKGMTAEQKAELDKKIVEGNVTNGITKAWNRAISLATIRGIDFFTEKVFTDYVSKIDEKGISNKERDKRIEAFLSDMRIGYANLMARREREAQAVEKEEVTE